MSAAKSGDPSESGKPDVGPPLGLLAELTHRCPLRCPYCSNPLELEKRDTELSTDEWKRVLSEAAGLGVLQVHLSGGEPTRRPDLESLVEHCRAVGFYSNLVTAGVALAAGLLERLAEAGLDHVQLSVQAPEPALNDLVTGRPGSLGEKLSTAQAVRDLDLPLTINFVVHRLTIERLPRMIELAVDLGARRLEVAHAQYYGWALENRQALMPTRDQVMAAVDIVDRAREAYRGRIVIDSVVPDYYARYPKPCMGGWARNSLNITPSGRALPCHAAETIPGVDFPSVRREDLKSIWYGAPLFQMFRGIDWMPDRCRGCDRREIDWGGCRCQALAITGNVGETDPACEKSPWHDELLSIARRESTASTEFLYRSFSR